MRIRHRGRDDKIELQMTPMIDIVFQLNIFFLFTFKIVLPEGDFNMQMPSAAAARAAEPSELPPLRLVMKAGADRRAGRPAAGGPVVRQRPRRLRPAAEVHSHAGRGDAGGAVGGAGSRNRRRLQSELRLRRAGDHGRDWLHRKRPAAQAHRTHQIHAAEEVAWSKEHGAGSKNDVGLPAFRSWLLAPCSMLPATSCPRMKRRVDLLEPRVVDVRVDLRRGDAGVAEHFLHLPQVGAAGQQMRGEAVAQ